MLTAAKKLLSRSLYPDYSSRISMVSPFLVGETFSCVVNKPLKAGYYMIECLVAGDEGNGEARFFWADKNDGKGVACFPFRLNKLAKRVVWLGKAFESTKVKLDCTSGKIQKISNLRFVPLNKSFAEKRMHRRLAGDLGQAYDAERLDGESEVYAAYDRLFLPFQADIYDRWIERVEPYLHKSRSLDSSTSVVSEEFHLVCADGYQLAANAKILMTQELSRNPDAVLVYADEDQIDDFGSRSNPYFKPDWNPDLFCSQDYISSCYLCRKDWITANQNVFDRYGERIALAYLLPKLHPEAIVHLPLVLAHHLIQEDTEPEVKNLQNIEEHQSDLEEMVLSNLPEGCQVEFDLMGDSLRIKYSLPEAKPLVSLLIPTRDGLAVLKPCVESILNKTSYPNYEILILDNQSQEEETLDWFASIADIPQVRILSYDRPFNYSAINNFGARHAKGSIIGLINNDVEVISPDWLTEMVSHTCRSEIGCVGAKLYYSNGQIQHAGVILGLGDVAGHSHRFLERDADGYHGRLKLVQNYSAVTAACLLVRREIYEAVEGLEEEHLTVAYNDVDFCLRVRAAGYRNLWTPYAELYHHESISRGEDDTPEKKARYDKEVAYMKARWGEELENDPCYNPNLSRRKEDFSLREFLF